MHDETQNFDILRFGLREWDQVKSYLMKEFYPLTPWHSEQENHGFTAYAFFDPETEKGVLFAFRQEKTEETTLSLKLPFADRAMLTNEDTKEKSMIENGEVALAFDETREAKLFWIDLI